jgi:prephenate dehydrogenase
MIGFVSQLTHAIAVSLMNCSDNTHLKEYTGDSFRDLTRIARINEVLWSELFFLNQGVLIEQIENFVDELNYLKQTLINKDEKELKRLFLQSAQRRKLFDK